MKQIYPVNEATCSPLVGQHVCAVLWDGTTVHGYLNEVSGGNLYFDTGYAGPSSISSKNPKKAKKQLMEAKDKASVSFFPFLGARFALGFAAVATLFLLPFAFAPFFFI
ncbi:hypothetical protein [Chengkuizengella axinellae]|uniref:Uncharacterized protein n=1 Tax=Chengkuizengella axinellae TaxID=3064388 RepID=A0ABT9J6U7_9BACL|nr:hypothetical protein [Chengkuizengella sp. 2205SS18-9]MDP5276689.1 hypothetical protein [Chengkuizengella sp. 2205SS18-9]